MIDNKYYNPMVQLISDTYKIDKPEVQYKIRLTEDLIKSKAMLENRKNEVNNYWILAAGYLSNYYKNK